MEDFVVRLIGAIGASVLLWMLMDMNAQATARALKDAGIAPVKTAK